MFRDIQLLFSLPVWIMTSPVMRVFLWCKSLYQERIIVITRVYFTIQLLSLASHYNEINCAFSLDWKVKFQWVAARLIWVLQPLRLSMPKNSKSTQRFTSLITVRGAGWLHCALVPFEMVENLPVCVCRRKHRYHFNISYIHFIIIYIFIPTQLFHLLSELPLTAILPPTRSSLISPLELIIITLFLNYW